MLNHRLLCCLTTLALALAAVAQDDAGQAGAGAGEIGAPPAEAGAAATSPEAVAFRSQAAYRDIAVLTTLNSLGITADQATEMVPVLRDLRNDLRQLDEALAAQREQAERDLRLKRHALLVGEPAPPERFASLVAYRRYQTQDNQMREDAYALALTRVTRILTDAQRAMLVTAAINEVDPNAISPEEALRRDQAEVERQRAVYNQIVQLIRAGREQRDPDRFAMLAPTAARDSVTALTGLLPDNPLAQQLGAYFLERLHALYRMPPRDYGQNAPALAYEMMQATLYVLARAQAAGTGTGQAQPAGRIPASELATVVRYERTPLLLEELSKYRANPFRRR